MQHVNRITGKSRRRTGQTLMGKEQVEGSVTSPLYPPSNGTWTSCLIAGAEPHRLVISGS